MISEKDPYGNMTTFAMIDLVDKLCVSKPSIKRVNNSIQLLKNYNILNHLVSETDENGHTTQYFRNIYGNPRKLSIRMDLLRSFIYYLTGLLKKHKKLI